MAAASLERVLARPGMGGVTLRHVRAMVAEGLAQRWVAADGSVVVTQLLHEPAGTVCLIYLAEGALASLLELHERILAWATGQGCVKMRIMGRRGWQRVLPGYRAIATVMERDLWAE